MNVIVAGKQPTLTCLPMEDAVLHATRGIGVWPWASNDTGEPDVVLATCGDVPTLEGLAAVDILRARLHELRVRFINVVDLMRLQDETEHPHGLQASEFDALFTTDRPIIFAFHGYPWLIHRLTYRRTNHGNLHVRGYKEEGTVTTPFDMVMRNDLDRFHLVMDVIDRVPKLGSHAIQLRQEMADRRVEARAYAEEHGEDPPEIRDWTWPHWRPCASSRSTRDPAPSRPAWSKVTRRSSRPAARGTPNTRPRSVTHSTASECRSQTPSRIASSMAANAWSRLSSSTMPWSRPSPPWVSWHPSTTTSPWTPYVCLAC